MNMNASSEPKYYHRDKEGNPQRTQIGAGQNASAPSSDEILQPSTPASVHGESCGGDRDENAWSDILTDCGGERSLILFE
jgi:hypothetical protein